MTEGSRWTAAAARLRRAVRPTPAVRRVARPLLAVAGLAAVVVLVVYLPRIGGTSWSTVLGILTRLRPRTLVLLTAVWLAGLAGYTFVQVAALPGLGHRRALALNLSSSAVANGVPGGGPLSLGVNWAMLRSWGFTAADFSTYTLVTTVTATSAKLSLPLLAGAAVLATGGSLPSGVRGLLLVAAGALTTVAVLLVVAAFLPARFRRVRVVGAVTDLMRRSGAAVRRSWHGLLTGVALQLGLQYLLFLLCLAVTGTRLGPVPALVAFATGRALSALPITPGGTGVTETGSGALLVALGADPGPAVAGVVLFSVFVVLLEIPSGALALAWWRLSPSRRRRCGPLPRPA